MDDKQLRDLASRWAGRMRRGRDGRGDGQAAQGNGSDEAPTLVRSGSGQEQGDSGQGDGGQGQDGDARERQDDGGGPQDRADADDGGHGESDDGGGEQARGRQDNEGDDDGDVNSSGDLAEKAAQKRDERPPLPDGPDASEHETAAGTDIEPTHALPAQGNARPPQAGDDGQSEEKSGSQAEDQSEEKSGSRVSVVDEDEFDRPEPPEGADEDEYKYHTYKVYPSGRPDAVEFIDTYKGFGRAKILRGLNMGLPEGMVSMILGPSGTGKSVCIKHMVGLLYPDRGDVLVHGDSVPNMADEDMFEMRKKFGLLFQDGALFGSMNLFDNVAFPLRQHTEKGEDEIGEIVNQRLEEVGLADAADKMPNELSGGMRKRAGFARALVLEPDIVLFDEPDSGLDPVRTALLGELILDIHRDMMEEAKKKEKEHLPTFAVITHDIMSARRVADYINVLWRGRIVEAGPAEDMLNSENPFIRQFLAGESEGPLAMD
jgi:phospholipid/cholesterol/gamma-HCH transport system ATP-binding protein